ncbi:hypothetical protein BRC91_09385 [Halobacteriales archaeon QS_4_62_28]|nr:MAG: hypothetical protein BRC91_09385 [Halobacteriales archaeon QS_4_62_28]
MDMAGGSSNIIGEGIESLQKRHGSFPVNQTTLSLRADAYHDASERASEGIADVYVRVYNDNGDVLHIGTDGQRRVPRCVGDSGRSLKDRARNAVEESTGVTCSIEQIVRVTIAGVRNADDPDAETVYRLLVLFDGSRSGGKLRDGVWQSDPETPGLV